MQFFYFNNIIITRTQFVASESCTLRKLLFRYTLTMVKRSDGAYTSFTVHADAVVLAVPPFSIRQFSVAREGLNPVLFAVWERRLG